MRNLLATILFLTLSFDAAADIYQDARAVLAEKNSKKMNLFFKAHQKVLAAKAPGLLGKWLEQKGDFSSACSVYQKDLQKRPTCDDGVKLRLATCYVEQKEFRKATTLFKDVLQHPSFRREINVLYWPLHYLLQRGEFEWVESDLAGAILTLRASDLDALRRERLAQALMLLVLHMKPAQYPMIVERALLKLYLELPETKAAAEVWRQDTTQTWLERRTLTDNLMRARVLTTLNRNSDVVATLEPYLVWQRPGQDAFCETHYLVGKATRRQRRYQQANEILSQVVDNCSGDTKRDAFFIKARLAAMDPSQSALSLLNRFLETYPNHSFADDVLIWKISVLEKIGSPRDVGNAFTELFEKYPNGDMIQDARFRRAFFFATQNDFGAARELLRAVNENASPINIDERAAYWYGRFLLSPSLTSFEPNENLEDRSLGAEMLERLAVMRPNSYYGFLARYVVDDFVRRKWIEQKKLVPDGKTQEKSMTSPKDAPLMSDSEYRQAECLIDAGYDDEAMLVLDGLMRARAGEDDRIALARAYLKIDRPDKTHQVMRYAGLSFPKKFSAPADREMWRLAFPLAFKREMSEATAKAHLPPYLLFGLAREESAFDAQAISWAGARGLCQLMEPVAFEEAARHKLVGIDSEKLLEPSVNTLLGAYHFADQLRQVEHPLLAIAAYNGGVGSVKRWVSQLAGPRPIDVFVEQIPFEETRNYVKRVATAWITYAWLDNKLDEIQFPLMVQKP